jgi:hypothetical protein
MWVSLFDEMMVTNEAFILIQFRIQEMADELLGVPRREMQMIPRHFPPKIIQNFPFLMFPRFRDSI